MLLIVYLALITLFSFIDPYHHYFYASGSLPVIYNFARLIYIVYFIWIYYAVGDALLKCLDPKLETQTYSLNRFVLGFITGAGVWHVCLFAVGMAGLYQRWLLCLMGFIICALTTKQFTLWRENILKQCHQINWLSFLIIGLPLFLFLIVKGLYPAGGHDYYNHYFPYYRSVTESGSLIPNNVWYHFYYSKGDALYFMSMLMTDPLGPQLAGTVFILIGALMVYSLMRNYAVWRQLPFIAVALYFTFLIYTPGPIENLHQGGWGDLEKSHEPAAMMMLGIVWLTYQLSMYGNNLSYRISLIATVAALVFISPTMAPFAGFYLFINAARFAYRRDWQVVMSLFLGMVTTVMLFSGNLLLNYVLTGIPDDQSLALFFSIANFTKLSQWGVLADVVTLYQAKMQLIQHQVPLSVDLIFKIVPYLRLDVWWPLFLATVVVTIVCFCMQNTRRVWLRQLDKRALFVCASLFATVIIFSLAIGRDQPISFYRYTSFVYAPMLCFCLLLISPLMNTYRWRLVISILLIVIIFPINTQITKKSKYQNQIKSMMGRYKFNNIESLIPNSLRFVTGQYSIADAYRHQQGWPGREPWGGIYPAMESIWKMLPPKTRIWSMHVHSYCMLPDCYVEGINSFRYTNDPLVVLFGTPAEAKKILQAEQLNYFFIAKDLKIEDIIQYSPLFAPEHISENFGVAWSDGNNVLLTWKELASRPIDAAWLKQYSNQIATYMKKNPYRLNFLHAVLSEMHDKGELNYSFIKERINVRS